MVIAFLISRPGVLDDAAAEHLIGLADQVVGYGFWTAFVKAIFAGWLMTILTWLLLAADALGPRLVIIWLMGTLFVLVEYSHVIISSTEVLMAIMLGAPLSAGDCLGGGFLPILVGNLIGVVVFVTLLHYVQALYARR